MKTLVLYYSRTGKTAETAKTLAIKLGSDLIEVTDSKSRNSPLGYISASMDAFRENKTKTSPSSVDLSSYGLIYIGSPVWAGKPSPAIISIIDKCNFQNKDVILFVTFGGSGGKKTIERMREKIEMRGGRMINSFSIKTAGKSTHEISKETKKLIEEMDLKIYES